MGCARVVRPSLPALGACFKCGLPGVARVECTKQSLCRECFCRQFEERVRKANYRYKLLRRGDVVGVGVSGGKDSTAMLYVLSKLAAEIGGITLKPVFVDEGIRGYRSEAGLSAEALCRQLGLKLNSFSFKDAFGVSLDEAVAKRGVKGLGACSYCGVLRKRLLNSACRELGCNKLAIGHTADDFCQTFLMNFLRGDAAANGKFGVFVNAGVKGFVPRIKPLAFNLEADCEVYCRCHGLPFYGCKCPYSKEAFRGLAEDFLNEADAKYPGVKFNFLSCFLSPSGKRPRRASHASCPSCGESYSGSAPACKACEVLGALGVRRL